MIEGPHEISFYGFLALHDLCVLLKDWGGRGTSDVPAFISKISV